MLSSPTARVRTAAGRHDRRSGAGGHRPLRRDTEPPGHAGTARATGGCSSHAPLGGALSVALGLAHGGRFTQAAMQIVVWWVIPPTVFLFFDAAFPPPCPSLSFGSVGLVLLQASTISTSRALPINPFQLRRPRGCIFRPWGGDSTRAIDAYFISKPRNFVLLLDAYKLASSSANLEHGGNPNRPCRQLVDCLPPARLRSLCFREGGGRGKTRPLCPPVQAKVRPFFFWYG